MLQAIKLQLDACQLHILKVQERPPSVQAILVIALVHQPATLMNMSDHGRVSVLYMLRLPTRHHSNGQISDKVWHSSGRI